MINGDIYRPPVNHLQTGMLQISTHATWNIGPGGIGYGDGDDVTLLQDSSYSIYLRIKFQVDDTAVIEQVLLDIDYDDAFVAYLNGNEIARSFNITDDTPAYNSTLTTDHEAKMYRGIQPDRFPLPRNTNNLGENTLAVQESLITAQVHRIFQASFF